jgi:hypothetical protein
MRKSKGERMKCIRCGREEKIEKHHIKARIDGGSDEPENKEERCSACHDYEHTRRAIVNSIKSFEDQLARAYKLPRKLALRTQLELLKHRLEVLDALNTPEQIRATGKYTSYWVDETTHNIIPIPKDDENSAVAEQVKLL